MMNGLMSKMKLDNKIGISILGVILVFSAGSIYHKENYMQSLTVSMKKLLKISLLQNTTIALNNGIAIDSFK